MREAVQFRSLSFRVFALRGSQPGKKKKSGAAADGEENPRREEGENTGTRAKFERAEWKEK